MGSMSIAIIAVSSTNVPSRVFSFSGRSLVKILNRKGARSLPWGTSSCYFRVKMMPFIFVTNVLCFKKNLISKYVVGNKQRARRILVIFI